MRRLNHLGNVLQTHWSEDPAIRGKAKMLGGALLVAEGVFGLIRGGAGTTKKGKQRRGRVGGLIGGSVLLVAGTWTNRAIPRHP